MKGSCPATCRRQTGSSRAVCSVSGTHRRARHGPGILWPVKRLRQEIPAKLCVWSALLLGRRSWRVAVQWAVGVEQGVLASVGEVDDEPDDEPNCEPQPGLPVQLQDEEQRREDTEGWHHGHPWEPERPG